MLRKLFMLVLIMQLVSLTSCVKTFIVWSIRDVVFFYIFIVMAVIIIIGTIIGVIHDKFKKK